MHRESSKSRVVAQGPSSCYEKALTDHYQVLRAIGAGSFGKVVLARHLLTGAEVAVKVVRKTEEYESERDSLMALEHESVIQLFQVIETADNMYLVMEHASGGELPLHIPLTGGREGKVRRLFREMVRSVQYCHEKGIAHLDLKPENFVVDARGYHPKLIDFGLSTSFTPGQKMHGFRGTLEYCAPEVIQGEEFECPPADVWSLGATLYFMLTGQRPFRAITNKRLEKQILQGRYTIPRHVSKGPRSLIQQILRVDPTKRPTLKQVMQHPWLSQGRDPSPSAPSQPLPKRPDPIIMTMMCDMGYDPYRAWLSLANRQFDEAMATYLLLRRQRIQGPASALWAKSGPNGVVGPRRGPASDPPSVRPHKCPSEPQGPEKAKSSAHKDAACASLPPVLLRLLHVKIPSSNPASQQDPGPQWHVHFRLSPGRRVAEGAASQDGSTGQPSGRSRGWRWVTRRMATCLQHLCCCLPCFHRPAFHNRVAPMGRGHRPPRFHNRVAPMGRGHRPRRFHNRVAPMGGGHRPRRFHNRVAPANMPP